MNEEPQKAFVETQRVNTLAHSSFVAKEHTYNPEVCLTVSGQAEKYNIQRQPYADVGTCTTCQDYKIKNTAARETGRSPWYDALLH